MLEHGRTGGAVRITQSVAAVNRAVRTSILDLAALAGVVLLLGLAAGALIARQIALPIRRLDRAARRVAEGDLDTAVERRGQLRAALAGTRLQRDDRSGSSGCCGPSRTSSPTPPTSCAPP